MTYRIKEGALDIEPRRREGSALAEYRVKHNP
jgi:hypothetical protein